MPTFARVLKLHDYFALAFRSKRALREQRVPAEAPGEHALPSMSRPVVKISHGIVGSEIGALQAEGGVRAPTRPTAFFQWMRRTSYPSSTAGARYPISARILARASASSATDIVPLRLAPLFRQSRLLT